MSAALEQLLGIETPSVAWPARLGDHLSASSLADFQSCPERYRRKRILGQWEPRSAALHWGGAHHAALEANFAQKIATHEDLPLDEVQDAFRDAFVRDSIDEVEWREDENPNDIMEAGLRLVGAYHERVAHRVQPLAVEEAFSLTIPGVPVPVIGRIDLRGLVDGLRRTVEFKTSSKSMSGPKVDWHLQGRIYRLAIDAPMEWHVAVKNTTSEILTPLEKPALLYDPSPGRTATVNALLLNRVRQLVMTFETFGPDEPWPDAVGSAAVFAPVPTCDYCAFGPLTGDSSCAYWGAA